MNSSLCKSSFLKLLCNRCKSQNISIIILLLVCNKALVTFTNNIISTIIFDILLTQHRLAVTLYNSGRKYSVGGFYIAITIIHAQNNSSVHIVFSNLSHTKILQILMILAYNVAKHDLFRHLFCLFPNLPHFHCRS